MRERNHHAEEDPPDAHGGKALRYYSGNTNVASVTDDGTVTAVSPGTCTIYALANNGVRTAVKVTVTHTKTK